LLLLILVACESPGATQTPVAIVNTKVIPTNTLLPPSPVPSIPWTQTPEPRCDPFRADFCITEGHFILQRPIRPPANPFVDAGYPYGSTQNGTRDPHHGVEFSNPGGTPVYAAAAGTVLFAGPDIEAVYAPWPNYYGNLVIIEHDDELFTLYAHLSKIDVKVGQSISLGDKIGEVGRSGGAIGSHLHFEVRRGNVEDYFATQNPELWLIPVTDATGTPFGTLMIAALDGDGELVRQANFTIGYYPDPSQPPSKMYYALPYSPDLLKGEESAVLGDLPAGHYRIAVQMSGQLYERWVEVESGKLTQAVFVAN
jgi:hypothetical protein